MGNLTPRPLYPLERVPAPMEFGAGWDPRPVCMVLEKDVKAPSRNKVGRGLRGYDTVQSD